MEITETNAAKIEMVELPAKSQPVTITVADGLLLGIVALGAILRFANLGETPLSPAEAKNALSVWEFWQPGDNTQTLISPLYFSLTSLFSQILGSSDAIMRLVPALAGLGLIILPRYWQRWLGNAGMLTVSFLIAISPLTTVISRTANGDSLALFCALLLLTAVFTYQTTHDKKWLTITAVSLGLGLTTAPLFYSALIILAIAYFLQQRLGPKLEIEDWRLNTSRQSLISNLAIPLLLSFLAASTLFLWNPTGMGAAARILGNWVGQLGLSPQIAEPFWALARYELLLLLLGITALVWAVRQDSPLATFFAYWFLLALVWLVVQQGTMSNILLVMLPVYFLLGSVSQSIFAAHSNWLTWLLAGGLLVLGALTLANFTRYVRLASQNGNTIAPLWFTAMGILIAAFAFFVVVNWDEETAAYQGFWLGLLGLLFFLQWGTAWELGHRSANDPRERWVGEATDDDMRFLATTIRDVSRQGSKSDVDLELFSAVDTPVLRWYLRPFRQVQFGNTIPTAATHQAIITRAGIAEPGFGSNYLGTDFGYYRPPVNPELYQSGRPLIDTFLWWLFHDSPIPIPEERLVLWVRSDVAQPR
ncbi:MAG: glycosyltransferase family 39 protein [Chloroflexota bacterium]